MILNFNDKNNAVVTFYAGTIHTETSRQWKKLKKFSSSAGFYRLLCSPGLLSARKTLAIFRTCQERLEVSWLSHGRNSYAYVHTTEDNDICNRDIVSFIARTVLKQICNFNCKFILNVMYVPYNPRFVYSLNKTHCFRICHGNEKFRFQVFNKEVWSTTFPGRRRLPADKIEKATPYYNVQHGICCKLYFIHVQAHPLAKILIGIKSKKGVILNCTTAIFT